ncbi:carbohydrate ABC transporter permease [Mycoplasma bradburyae]|uniref:Carbohydrate ABC transporter permease n=1 Tax=Mycoplasma bradburyae TaxID=2963128 RepID=A0AAW6HN40_9MOLU|nr:carbohydrate ABC transporter permease [Mycoplasma bradburyae]MDC4163256.1 carbohydrate ABC transporter permease [Mycoplasma bradburyae]MDC4181870.1 carbohydrate ABC transporter permease [Mycoplasma bradburyae]MDC4182569.1 carbohydrate ABC transporter permease [Mycoplasma bradburyae]MDC4183247.1 carbohydrate ABC transporter permease [Mycoplasma bradburyae]MDC4184053.1 carbohydrate ABC transporter permease [Mycoplasma bradburyae]
MFALKLKFKNWISKIKINKNYERVSLEIKDTSWKTIILGFLFKSLILLFFGLIIIFPFYFMLVVALAPDKQVLDQRKPILWPDSFNFNNFARVLNEGGYWSALFVTAFITALSVILRLFFTMTFGYAFSLRNWKFKKVVWLFYLSILILPESALLIGQFRTITLLEWNDRADPKILISLVTPYVASIFSGYMFKNAFEAIPGRIKESALIDGCGGAKFFFKVAIPLVKPTIWTVTILTSFAAWNSYLWPLLLLDSQSKFFNVINLWVIRQGIDPNSDPDGQIIILSNLRMAATILAIVPMFIVYFIFRKQIINAVGKRGNSTIKG